MQIWDFSTHLNALAESETEVPRGASSDFNQAPLFNFKGHKDEVYAIDWSPRVTGRLVTGTVTFFYSVVSHSRIFNALLHIM
jgi:ribosome assembly protein RRB1